MKKKKTKKIVFNEKTIDKLLKICEKATDPPWFFEEHVCGCCAYVTNQKGKYSSNIMYGVNGMAGSWHENAEFIASAREALPAALKEIRRLKRQNKKQCNGKSE